MPSGTSITSNFKMSTINMFSINSGQTGNPKKPTSTIFVVGGIWGKSILNKSPKCMEQKLPGKNEIKSAVYKSPSTNCSPHQISHKIQRKALKNKENLSTIYIGTKLKGL